MCTKPNYLVFEGEYQLKTKKSKKLIEDLCDDFVKLPSDYQTWIEFGDSVPKLKFIGSQPYSRMKDLVSPWIQVPCGQCLECRIQQARTWADRVVLEAKKYKYNYFITLTYDDYHLPTNFSLVPDDLSLFVRRVRKRFKDCKIRFFGCGEYGDLSRRPHYHIILFNCPLSDLSYDFKQADWIVEDGHLKFNRLISHLRPQNSGDLKYSELIHKCWDFKGQISVGEVTYDSAAYVSQYVTKKHKPGMKEFYENLNIEPEFVRMSTHPGIAADYFNERDDYLIYDEHMIVPSKGEAHLSTIPRYFQKLFIKKYGEDVFAPVRSKRYEQRINKLNKNIHLCEDLDYQACHRDYRLKKKQKIRQSI